MPNFATQLEDIAITRAVLLQQLGSSMTNEVREAYLLILDDIRSSILKHDAIDLIRTRQIIREIKAISFPKLDLYNQFEKLSIDERDWLVSTTNATAGAEIFRAIPPDSAILAIGRNASMEGGIIKDWFGGMNRSIIFNLERSVKLSMLEGESTQEAAARFSKVMGVSMNEAETLVRSGIAFVSANVREEVYKANEDVIKGRRHVSVMDGKTSSICVQRSGAEWDNNGKGINEKGKLNAFRPMPLHPRERSHYSPIMKSFAEIDPSLSWIGELPATTRATMDGQRPSDFTFEQFLSNKSDKFIDKLLGSKRAEMFLSGKITLNDLVTKGGRSRTLSELKLMSEI